MPRTNPSSHSSSVRGRRGKLYGTLCVTFLFALVVTIQVAAQGRSCQTDTDCGGSQLDPFVCTADTRLCVPGDCVLNSECSSADPTKFCNNEVGRCAARRGEGGLCVDAFGLSDEAICMPGLSCTSGTCRARGQGSGGVSSTSQPSSVPASKPASSLPPSRTPDPSPQVSRTGSPSTPTAVARSPTSTTKSEPIGGTRLSAQDASSPATDSKANSSSFSLLGLVIGLGLAALAVLLAITVLQTRRARNKKKAEDDAFLRRVVANNMGRRPPATSTATRSNSAGSQSTPTNRSPASTADRPGAAPSSSQFPPPNNHANDSGPPLYPSARHQPYQADAQYPQPSLYPAQPPQHGPGVPTALAPAPMPQPNQVYFAESSFSDSHSHLQGHIPHGQYHHHHGSQLPPPPPSHLERPSPAFAQNPRPRRGS